MSLTKGQKKAMRCLQMHKANSKERCASVSRDTCLETGHVAAKTVTHLVGLGLIALGDSVRVTSDSHRTVYLTEKGQAWRA